MCSTPDTCKVVSELLIHSSVRDKFTNKTIVVEYKSSCLQPYSIQWKHCFKVSAPPFFLTLFSEVMLYICNVMRFFLSVYSLSWNLLTCWLFLKNLYTGKFSLFCVYFCVSWEMHSCVSDIRILWGKFYHLKVSFCRPFAGNCSLYFQPQEPLIPFYP